MRSRVSFGVLAVLIPCSVGAAPEPDWVKTGGTSARYPNTTHLTGFGAVEQPQGIERAKAQAAADLAKRITVRIEHEASDVSMERNGESSYAVAALTRATTDVRVSGLTFEIHDTGRMVYALAVLERASAIRAWRAERDQAVSHVRTCMEVIKSDPKAALACRSHVSAAMAAHQLLRTLGTPAEPAVDDELARTSAAVEQSLQGLAGSAATSLGGLTDALATQLATQGMGRNTRWQPAPLTYGTTPFSSPLGRQLVDEVQSAMLRQPSSGAPSEVVLGGTYFEANGHLEVRLLAREVSSGRPLASAGGRIPLSAVPEELPFKPQNFDEALRDQRLLGAGELVSGTLKLDLWTNKGDRNLVFGEGDDLKIYFRVNQPAYVRLIYVLASGAKVPLEQAYFVDASKVNHAIEYPDAFTVAPPFGVEQVFAAAFTEKPALLPTVKTTIEGEQYDVVSDVGTLVKHRGIKRKKATAQITEATLVITTMRR